MLGCESGWTDRQRHSLFELSDSGAAGKWTRAAIGGGFGQVIQEVRSDRTCPSASSAKCTLGHMSLDGRQPALQSSYDPWHTFRRRSGSGPILFHRCNSIRKAGLVWFGVATAQGSKQTIQGALTYNLLQQLPCGWRKGTMERLWTRKWLSDTTENSPKTKQG